MIIVSPSSPHAVVELDSSKVSVLYEVESSPMLRYMLVLVDWIEPSMLKYSDDASGPRTTIDAGILR